LKTQTVEHDDIDDDILQVNDDECDFDIDEVLGKMIFH
jgi:hypothetical protein